MSRGNQIYLRDSFTVAPPLFCLRRHAVKAQANLYAQLNRLHKLWKTHSNHNADIRLQVCKSASRWRAEWLTPTLVSDLYRKRSWGLFHLIGVSDFSHIHADIVIVCRRISINTSEPPLGGHRCFSSSASADALRVNKQHELQDRLDSWVSTCWSRDSRHVLFFC